LSAPSRPPAPARRPSTFTQYRTLLVKDLKREFHTRDMLTAMGVYALLVLVVFGAALTQTARGFDILQMSGGLIWALIVFTSLLGLNRSFAHEKEEAALEGVLLAPLDRSVIFLAKASSNLLFLVAVEIIALPLFFFFFLTGSELAPTSWLALGPLLAGSVGIAGVGTLLATITMNTRGKDVLLAVLFIPLIFPLLYACVSATTAAILGTGAVSDTWLPALALAIGYDVVMVLASWLLYDFTVST
jgi:heme exporter protein B